MFFRPDEVLGSRHYAIIDMKSAFSGHFLYRRIAMRPELTDEEITLLEKAGIPVPPGPELTYEEACLLMDRCFEEQFAYDHGQRKLNPRWYSLAYARLGSRLAALIDAEA